MNYIEKRHKNLKYATKDDPSVVVYGKDEFKIDEKKNRIRIPIIGWIKIETLDFKLKDVSWIAIKYKGNEYSLIFASGFSPYDEIEKNDLYENGEIFAVPYSIM